METPTRGRGTKRTALRVLAIAAVAVAGFLASFFVGRTTSGSAGGTTATARGTTNEDLPAAVVLSQQAPTVTLIAGIGSLPPLRAQPREPEPELEQPGPGTQPPPPPPP